MSGETKTITLFHLDDSSIARKIFKSYFYGNYTKVIDASDIESSLKIISDSPDIHCFIIDLNIGEKTSFDLIRKINAIPKYYMAPIILRTAGLTTQIEYESMKCGVNQCVPKMLPPKELKKIIAAQINKPEIKIINRDYFEVYCATWEKNGEFFQYCPEMNMLFSDSTEKGVKQKVKEAIEKHLKSGEQILGNIHVTHDIHQIKVD